VVIEPFSHIFTIEHDDFTMDFTWPHMEKSTMEIHGAASGWTHWIPEYSGSGDPWLRGIIP
jgi:hypothetical protein